MDFQLTPEQEELRKKAKEFAEKEILPYLSKWIADRCVPREVDRKLAEWGIAGRTYPVKYGGQGRPFTDAMIVSETLSRVGAGAAIRSIFYGELGPMRTIAFCGTEEQKAKYIPMICKGELRTSFGMTEPDAGTALTDLKTRAVEDGESYILNGHKNFVIGAGDSDLYLVYVKYNDIPGSKGIGAVLVEKGTPGMVFQVDRSKEFMGMNIPPQGDIFFHDCRVPKKNVLVKAGEFGTLMAGDGFHRIGNAIACLGHAEWALDLATKWSLERKQFGKPICDFQAIQLKLADMAIWVEAMRALVYSATTTAEKGAPNVLLGSIAKAFADETVRSVVSNAVQIYGGYGYSCEYPLESLLRETWGFGIGGGTIDILKVRIASELLNRKFDQRK